MTRATRREFVSATLGAASGGALALMAAAPIAKARAASPLARTQDVPPEFPAAAAPKPYVAGSAERELDIINLHELEAEARKLIPEGPFGYIAGGSGDEWTLRENTRSFDDHQILPRMLAGVTTPDISTTLLGAKVGTPIFIPPMAAHGLAHVSAEKGTARGAAESKALFCTQTLANTPLEEIAQASEAGGGGAKWFQLYYSNDQGINRELIQRAKATRTYPKTSLRSRSEQPRWRKPVNIVVDFSQRMHSLR